MLIAKLFFNKRWVSGYRNNNCKTRLYLEQFTEKRTTSHDIWNTVPNSEINIQYLTLDNKEVGFINYRLSTGQIKGKPLLNPFKQL